MRYTLILLLCALMVVPCEAGKKKKRKLTEPDPMPFVVNYCSTANAIDTVAFLESLGLHYKDIKKYNRGTWQGNIQWKLDSLCHSDFTETSQLGVMVYDLTADSTLYCFNHRQRMRPASCMKVITAVTALDLLGGEYKLNTVIKTNGKIDNHTLKGDLYIIGTMDPVLSKSDVMQMTRELKQAGINRINGNIYFDLSFRDDKELGFGWCWDDDYGPLTALSVDGKDNFKSELVNSLKRNKITYSSKITKATAPLLGDTLCVIQHTIDDVLEKMMKNSDNIYAESMFYQIAGYERKPGAGRKQAVPHVENLIERIGLNPANYQIADGSGLSLYNYVSPQLLVEMLKYAWNNEEINKHLYTSLPIAGVDGTLKNRMKYTKAYGNLRAKTGTVDGIISLSGYVTASNKHVLVFSLISQGVASKSDARAFHDKLCLTMCE